MLKLLVYFTLILLICDQTLAKKPIGTINIRPPKPMDKPVPHNQAIDAKRPMKSAITTSGYSHENTTKLDNSDWMSHIADSTRLMELSLPGTHESMALFGGDIAQCQSLSLETQLRAGIRVLDIRCRHSNNALRIQHESYDQKADFNQVMTVLIQFLTQNPTEVVLVTVREEFKPNANNQSFEDTFRTYVSQDLFAPFVWEANAVNPTLGEVRRKIVFLQDFVGRKTMGLDYKSFDTQDDNEVKTIFRLYDKWEKVKKQLIKTDKHKGEGYYANYLSGNTGYFGRLPLFVTPYFVAGGRSDHRTNSPLMLTGRTTLINRDVYPDFPRVYCLGSFCLVAFEGTNDLTLKYIQNERPEFVGILMIDFPGDALIDAIIRLNRLSNALSDKQSTDFSTEPSEQSPTNSSDGSIVSGLADQDQLSQQIHDLPSDLNQSLEITNSKYNHKSKSKQKSNSDPNTNTKTNSNEINTVRPVTVSHLFNPTIESHISLNQAFIVGPNKTVEINQNVNKPLDPNKPFDSIESNDLVDDKDLTDLSDESYSGDSDKSETSSTSETPELTQTLGPMNVKTANESTVSTLIYDTDVSTETAIH